MPSDQSPIEALVKAALAVVNYNGYEVDTSLMDDLERAAKALSKTPVGGGDQGALAWPPKKCPYCGGQTFCNVDQAEPAVRCVECKIVYPAQPISEGERERVASIITGEEKPPVGSYPSAHRAWNAALAKADQIIALRQNQSQGDGWREIETAPRDGSEVLLAHSLSVFTGHWQDGTGYAGGNGEGWVTGETDSFEDWTISQPTHWMPLPAAPSPEQGG